MLRRLRENEKVFVYWNLHKNLFSVQDASGRVVAHMESLVLLDSKFVVRPAGRARVLREGVKNVHAGVSGRYSSSTENFRGATRVTYNPYKAPTFVKKRLGDPIYGSAKAILRCVLDNGRRVPRVYARGHLT